MILQGTNTFQCAEMETGLTEIDNPDVTTKAERLFMMEDMLRSLCSLSLNRINLVHRSHR